MVDAMSLSTTAAARQKEMNDSATVVATTTFARLAVAEFDVCIALINEKEVETVGSQYPQQLAISESPPDIPDSNHNERAGFNSVHDRFGAVPA
jgi:hypothetical protein